jgi:hypothetical protein
VCLLLCFHARCRVLELYLDDKDFEPSKEDMAREIARIRATIEGKPLRTESQRDEDKQKLLDRFPKVRKAASFTLLLISLLSVGDRSSAIPR